MRRTFLAALLISVCASTSMAADTVYLNRTVLADLEQTNPEHYLRATKILAQASEVCQPGVGKPLDVKMDYPFNCSGFMLKTSYPPKRQVSFTLDGTYYVALVSLKSDTAKMVPAR